jgi:hypothetical protein
VDWTEWNRERIMKDVKEGNELSKQMARKEKRVVDVRVRNEQDSLSNPTSVVQVH